jgi:hypothetical protein
MAKSNRTKKYEWGLKKFIIGDTTTKCIPTSTTSGLELICFSSAIFILRWSWNKIKTFSILIEASTIIKLNKQKINKCYKMLKPFSSCLRHLSLFAHYHHFLPLQNQSLPFSLWLNFQLAHLSYHYPRCIQLNNSSNNKWRHC